MSRTGVCRSSPSHDVDPAIVDGSKVPDPLTQTTWSRTWHSPKVSVKVIEPAFSGAPKRIRQWSDVAHLAYPLPVGTPINSGSTVVVPSQVTVTWSSAAWVTTVKSAPP